jgi:hypothetical protein
MNAKMLESRPRAADPAADGGSRETADKQAAYESYRVLASILGLDGPLRIETPELFYSDLLELAIRRPARNRPPLTHPPHKGHTP